MSLTIGNVGILIGLTICCLLIDIAVVAHIYDFTDNYILPTIISALCTIGIVVGVAFGLSWYNTSTASGQRAYKDFQSEINNGIYREITITAEDGREIFYYKGKVDIESNHTDNYIKFESEDGRRYIIYYGIQDTIKIIECEENE